MTYIGLIFILFEKHSKTFIRIFLQLFSQYSNEKILIEKFY
jgi:hypothetical protein